MTVKLAILKSGENIICDIKEGFIEDKLVCYILNNPCSVVVNGSYKIIDDESDDSSNRISISFHPWPNLSDDTVVEIVLDWIVTLVNPKEQIKKMYEEQVLTNGKKDDQIDSINKSTDSIVSN